MSDLLVDDSPVRQYSRMLHPVFMKDEVPCFVIVDEMRDITLRLRMAVDTNGDVVEFFADAQLADLISPVIARLYGQLLVKTGIPKEFEISNAIGGGQL